MIRLPELFGTTDVYYKFSKDIEIQSKIAISRAQDRPNALREISFIKHKILTL
jgi:hypothetical protein